MGGSIKVVIADDHDIVRSGIQVLLNQVECYECKIIEVTSYKELEVVLQKDNYDLLILDLNLGDKMGVEMIREISDIYTDLPILVLSMYDEDPYALHSIQNGALGYVNKCNVKEQLTTAIQKVLSKEVYISDEYKKQIPYGTELKKHDIQHIDTLSKREMQIVYLLSQELTLTEISEHLDISYKTVHTYIGRILQKLSLADRTQLITFVRLHYQIKIS